MAGERGHSSNNGFSNGFSSIAEEKSPLVQLAKETIISLDYVGVSSFLNVNIGAQGTYTPTSPAKKDINQKDLKDSLADGLGEDDEESMDWWTKYFASIDTMIEVSCGMINKTRFNASLYLLPKIFYISGMQKNHFEGLRSP